MADYFSELDLSDMYCGDCGVLFPEKKTFTYSDVLRGGLRFHKEYLHVYPDDAA